MDVFSETSNYIYHFIFLPGSDGDRFHLISLHNYLHSQQPYSLL